MVFKGGEGLWKQTKASRESVHEPWAAVVLWQSLEWKQGPAEVGAGCDGTVGANLNFQVIHN